MGFVPFFLNINIPSKYYISNKVDILRESRIHGHTIHFFLTHHSLTSFDRIYRRNCRIVQYIQKSLWIDMIIFWI